MTDDASLFGIPDQVTHAQVEQLIFDLSRAWETVFDQPVGELENDLVIIRRWFDPVAQGQRLRREISDLPVMPESLGDPQPPLTVGLGPGRWLVTPEGRCALDLLKQLPAERAIHHVTSTQLAPYERRLAMLYRDWCRHRLDTVVALLSGTTKPLQIPATGILIALLVNRSTTEERSLIRYTSDPERTVVDKAFFAPVQAFADILSPNRRRGTLSSQLISGWILYEVRRRIGDAMVLVETRNGQDGAVWVKAECESAVLDTVARDLSRGHRTRVTVELFGSAFNNLVTELRHESKSLAGFGLAHERPRNTVRLREELTERIVQQGQQTA